MEGSSRNKRYGNAIHCILAATVNVKAKPMYYSQIGYQRISAKSSWRPTPERVPTWTHTPERVNSYRGQS